MSDDGTVYSKADFEPLDFFHSSETLYIGGKTLRIYG